MRGHHVSLAMLAGIIGSLFLGCSRSMRESAERHEMPSSPAMLAAKDAEGVTKSEAPARFMAVATGATQTSPQPNRKIIYNAWVSLVVEDFSGVPERVVALVKQFDAYVADSSLSGNTGDSRRGTWKIRVPVTRFDEFVNSSKGLGEVTSVRTESQDVSEEYYDVDARIRNKTKEEERLLALLENHPGKLEEVIAIERELSRVREELERMQGRLRVLADLTSLTTVELSVLEVRDYVPPEAPTLATRLRRSFTGSLAGLQTAGEELLVGLVGLVPWLGVLAVGALLLFVVLRRLIRRRAVA